MRPFREMYLVRLLHALRYVSSASPKKKQDLWRSRRDIKMAADASLALTSVGNGGGMGSLWRRALLTDMSRRSENNKNLVKKIAATNVEEHMNLIAPLRNSFKSRKSTVQKLGFRRSWGKKTRRAAASTVARRMVKERTEILRRLVPGGLAMDNFSLFKETADYIISLRAQVEVMKFLAHTFITN